jgi:hypothetical protein
MAKKKSLYVFCTDAISHQIFSVCSWPNPDSDLTDMKDHCIVFISSTSFYTEPKSTREDENLSRNSVRSKCRYGVKRGARPWLSMCG